MSIWTWKQSVAEQILEIVNSQRNTDFSIEQLYERQNAFQERFPSNRHIREKVRQILQRLRDDDGFIDFVGGGRYRLLLTHAELECEPARADDAGVAVPAMRTIVRSVRLRNTLLAAEMKRRYKDVCQVCREQLQLAASTYAESHHIRPMGSPHNGPDVEGNILVVCPNHHVMFDRGALVIDPSSFIVRHVRNAIEPRPLLVRRWHRLNRGCIEYHVSIAAAGA